ncbi:putative beta-lysine N-acetyltransferase [Bacillus sp. DNRA2]|uniref:putative beta-lysine N-acetyltransferase n=1 Tax=Bacillus sp. DNRA2 TaxID=2723053 RepID=UPI00145CE008|nr:putative beta-lysine N-acetyltransferase [Bacillus sp. DNRA2]
MIEQAQTQTISGDAYVLEVFIDPFNKRVRIDDYRGNLEKVIQAAELECDKVSAEKLICKVRQEHFTVFLEHGFTCEAKLDGYFLGSDMYFFCKYFQTERMENDQCLFEDQIIKNVYLLERQSKATIPPLTVKLRKAVKSDVKQLAKLYREVFEVYPTPLHDPAYIEKTFQDGTIYFVIEQDGEIISAASAEVNSAYKNAELTDCATLLNHRKHGYVKLLLKRLEEELTANNIYCAYSLSRAQSFGMNAAFYQLGYNYRGRLLNNCYIYDQIENMNLWVKDLSK